MFGYVRPAMPELKVREAGVYRSAYCGLCRAMGKRTGCLSRLTLNYDFVFLALVRMGLEGIPLTTEKHRCLRHPFRRREMLARNDALDYSAVACALLTAAKNEDDLRDERGFRRFGARMLLPFTRSFAKCGEEYEPLAKLLKEQFDALHTLEEAGSDSIDDCAETFGAALSGICSFGIEDERKKRIAAEIGHALGRWIYIADAVDDYDEDGRKKRFNPIRSAYGENPVFEDVMCGMGMDIRHIWQAVDLVDFSPCPDAYAIVSNVLSYGMPATAERVSKKERFT